MFAAWRALWLTHGLHSGPPAAAEDAAVGRDKSELSQAWI